MHNNPVISPLKLLKSQRRLSTYATKIGPKVALYKNNLKITTDSKTLWRPITLISKYQINMRKTLKITW